MIDILKEKIVWRAHEMKCFKYLSSASSAPIAQCQFSMDGKKLIVMTKIGTISLYCADNDV
jgi:hypothetical protein